MCLAFTNYETFTFLSYHTFSNFFAIFIPSHNFPEFSTTNTDMV